MRCQSLLVFALLQLQTCMAAPADSAAALEHSKRCMTQSEIAAFQASWPANAGPGPELDACDDAAKLKRSPLSPPEIEDLVRRYLQVDELARRSAQTDKAKRCFTEKEIKEIQANWPPHGGRGPALVPCDPSASNDTVDTASEG